MSSGNDAQDAVNDLLEQYEAKLGNVAPKVGIPTYTIGIVTSNLFYRSLWASNWASVRFIYTFMHACLQGPVTAVDAVTQWTLRPAT